MKYFQGLVCIRFYPFFLENRNFMENLLKDNEHDDRGDILIKQIELKISTDQEGSFIS